MKLTIESLNKTYPDGVQALKNVSLTVYQGMFGLLGPNGAGKSTLMRILATLQEPDSGTVVLDDVNVLTEKNKVRSMLGYLPQEFGLYPRIGCSTLLDHFAYLKGMTHRGERKNAVESLLRKTNLWHVRDKALGSVSGGMKQRFGVAQALINNPRLIIVDEPTAGLDPAERNRFLNLLSEIGENTIVILSTHIVDDVRELCSQMAIIRDGQLLHTGRPGDSIRALQGRVWKKRITKEELQEYKANYFVVSEKLFEGMPEINVISDDQPDASFESVPASLEDVYFSFIRPAAESVSSH